MPDFKTSFLDRRQKFRQEGRNCISIFKWRFVRKVFFGRNFDFLTVFILILRINFANFCQKVLGPVLIIAFFLSGGTAWVGTSFFEIINQYRVSFWILSENFLDIGRKLQASLSKLQSKCREKLFCKLISSKKMIFKLFCTLNKNFPILAKKFGSLVKAAFDVIRRDLCGKFFFQTFYSNNPWLYW